MQKKWKIIIIIIVILIIIIGTIILLTLYKNEVTPPKKSSGKLPEKPPEKLSEKSLEKPPERPLEKPPEKLSEKSLEKPPERPLEKSSEKPSEISLLNPIGKSFVLIKNLNSKQYITIEGDINRTGPLVQEPRNSSRINAQLWTIWSPESARGNLVIVNSISGLSFDVMHGSHEPDTPILVYPYGAQNNQLWKIVQFNKGYRIINVGSGLPIGVQNNSFIEGAPIVQQSESNDEGQLWVFEINGSR
jgi:hypothetical protein